MLSHPTDQCTVDVVPCDSYKTCVLMQLKEGHNSPPIWNQPRVLTNAEQELTNTHKITWFQNYSSFVTIYPETCRSILRTEQNTLNSLLTSASALVKLTRSDPWVLKPGFEVPHHAYIKNHATICLSTVRTKTTILTNLDEELRLLVIDGSECKSPW